MKNGLSEDAKLGVWVDDVSASRETGKLLLSGGLRELWRIKSKICIKHVNLYLTIHQTQNLMF